MAGMIAVTTALAAAACTNGLPTNGPLYVGEEGDSTETSASSDVDGLIVWGGLAISNRGTEPAEIVDIRLNGDGDVSGVRIDAIYVADLTGKHGSTGVAREWPPPGQSADELRPAHQYVLQPKDRHPADYQVLIKITVLRSGTWRFGSYTVEYESKGARYAASHPDALRICTPMVSECAKPS